MYSTGTGIQTCTTRVEKMSLQNVDDEYNFKYIYIF